MTSQNRFNVFIKALGVWAFATGIGTLPATTFYLRRFSDAEDFLYMIVETVAEPLLFCGLGIWLIRSNWIAQKTYPPSGTIEKDTGVNFTQTQALELFSALLKTFGVWCILSGLARTPRGVDYFHDFAHVAGGYTAAIRFESMALPGLPIILGSLLLISMNWFIKLGFPKLIGTNDDKSPEPILAKPSHVLLFEVLTKTIGVWFIVLGINKLPHAITIASGGFSDTKAFFSAIVVIFGLPIMSVVVGGLCFFITELFSKFAFPAFAQKDSSAWDDVPS
jgi:hypothetical protein